MCSYLLKLQKQLVFTHMGLQLVPLVEVLLTALMVALKQEIKAGGQARTSKCNKPRNEDVLYIASPAAGELEPCGSSCCHW